MKARLAAVLLAERTRRGGGDPRRFPQPEMARLIDYSLRQYQRLEDENDSSIPTWNVLERIMGILDLDPSVIFAPAEEEEDQPTEDQMVALREEVAEVRAMVAELLGRSA